MTDLRQAAMQALEALTIYSDAQCSLKGLGAITALRTALEQPEQEPVACVIDGDLYFHHEIDWEDLAYQGHGVELLYTTPPAAQRPWVGLTDEEITELRLKTFDAVATNYESYRAIEAKLKERNNG